MKSKLKTFFSVSALALLLTFTPVVVTAQGTDTTNETTQTTTQTDEATSPAAIKSRTDKRKADFKTRVDAAKQARIKSRCKASQGKLSSISGRIKGLETSRTQVYENLLSRLDKTVEKLKAANIDTTTLEEQITVLETQITQFKTDLDAYKLAVNDIALMDCATDPTAFQASLEAARTARSKVTDSAKAIRTTLAESIKPILVDLKKQLGDTASTEETE